MFDTRSVLKIRLISSAEVCSYLTPLADVRDGNALNVRVHSVAIVFGSRLLNWATVKLTHHNG